MEVEEIPEEEFVQSSTPQKNLKVFFFILLNSFRRLKLKKIYLKK
jgi:hypothetical protein